MTVIVQDGETKKLPLNMMVTKQDIENKKVAGLAKLDEIEATYENDTYTPTITVKNKSSVKTGEGDEVDYSANVMDGPAKSAILKGQTLVNLAPKVEDSVISNYQSGNVILTSEFKPLTNLKANTEYTVLFKASNVVNATNGMYQYQGRDAENVFIKNNIKNYTLVNGYNKLTFTTSVEISKIQFLSYNTLSVGGSCCIHGDSIMIIEGDYTNVDIPYFTGMQSVKMPVLMTTGKNVFDLANSGLREESAYDKSMHGYGFWSFGVQLQPNKEVTISRKNNDGYKLGLSLKIHNENTHNGGNWIIANHAQNENKSSATITTNSDGYIWFIFSNNFDKINQILDICEYIQIEYGTVATSYEPYKTNILTVNEPVELRGIGDVQDTLDLVTGEVVERVGEVVLDGSEDWSTYITNEDTISFIGSNIADAINKQYDSTNLMADKLIASGYGAWTKANNITLNTKKISICVLKSVLEKVDVNGFKKWLSENPIKVQYIKADEPIKTVDLMPSGTHPSTTPYCWKNGHIQLSSSGLLPNLEYSVVTSRAGQINQNATMIVKNDKRIFDLEILLAGGLVNTTYQALTLQNQVETGLSKVSLSSETEPDYLLYHMIMKLIEEKAYKLDDLTEKVSVFYLYEKLSDEQFETIYSELYPFVEEEYIELPEDGEIIEEPIVDEVLEEVENGVVM